MAGAETRPLAGTGGELQIGTESRHTDHNHDSAARLQPGLQTTNRSGTETAGTRTDDDDIEPIDHRRQHVDPRRITADHHQPFQRHPHVGRSVQTDLR